MKKILLLLFAPVVLMLVLLFSGFSFVPSGYTSEPANTTIVQVRGELTSVRAKNKDWVRMESVTSPENAAITHNIIAYAKSLLGAPYSYSGITPAGFDCSGFVTYVFDKHDIDVPHSSKLQANEGVAVAKEEAAPGDLVIFTGTNEEVREPGHVGIVISEPGDTISFVHSSSNGGVKISKVQGTRYDVRFLEVRRVL